MDRILKEITESPKFNLYLDELLKIHSQEQTLRQHFYETVREDQKAEYINGEIIIHSPVKHRHSKASDLLFSLMQNYVIKHSLGEVRHEKIMIALLRNDYEPDISFFRQEKSGKFNPDQMLFPAPDLIIEVISPSTEKYDRGIKFRDYALHGVLEYWLVDAENEIIEQYFLKGEEYELNIKSNSGNIKSKVIKGFEIPIRAGFDEQEYLKVMTDMR
jgi:Uma2 family endonuclease